VKTLAQFKINGAITLMSSNTAAKDKEAKIDKLRKN